MKSTIHLTLAACAITLLTHGCIAGMMFYCKYNCTP